MKIDLSTLTIEELTKIVQDNNECQGNFAIPCPNCSVFAVHVVYSHVASCATIAATALKELTKRGAIKIK